MILNIFIQSGKQSDLAVLFSLKWFAYLRARLTVFYTRRNPSRDANGSASQLESAIRLPPFNPHTFVDRIKK